MQPQDHANEVNPTLDRTGWIDAFVSALSELQPAADRQRLLDFAATVWLRCGHLDPDKVAQALHKVWLFES